MKTPPWELKALYKSCSGNATISYKSLDASEPRLAGQMWYKKSMDKFVPLLQALQELRPGIPTYVIFDDIGPRAFRRINLRLQKAEPGDEIDIIINSPGGSPGDAYRMIRAFRNKYKIVNVIVPFWAKSAATLFAFGANRLVLAECGELGPIDAQIRKDDERSPDGEWSSALNVSASVAQIERRSREEMIAMFNQMRTPTEEAPSELIKIGRKHLAEMLLEYSAKFYAPLLQKIDPLEMGQMSRTLDIGRMYARRILKQYTDTPDEQIDALLYFLVYECPDHGYVVDYDVIKPFLDFAIKSSAEPFNEEYAKCLEQLTISLLSPELPVLNDFVSSFPVKQRPDIIENNGKQHAGNNKPESKGAETTGPSGGSEQNTDKKSDSANKPDVSEKPASS